MLDFVVKCDLNFALQPKYGGLIIDIVSRDLRTVEQQSEALEALMSTVIYMVLIVLMGYGQLYCGSYQCLYFMIL